jgi:hypothetical protein
MATVALAPGFQVGRTGIYAENTLRLGLMYPHTYAITIVQHRDNYRRGYLVVLLEPWPLHHAPFDAFIAPLWH